jgi:hypothetical protein
MAFFRNDPALAAAPLAPARPITGLPGPGTTLGRLARTWNSVGGLVETLARQTGIEPMAVLAVWYVESGGRAFEAGRPVLRFENHKFFRFWGAANPKTFDRHFQFGGRAGVTGKSSQNHRFRNPPTSPWRPFHGTQDLEYEVFEFAQTLATKDLACMSASFGGPQIMGFNHDACGYADAVALFDAFAADQRWQVLGFFDFCRMNGLIPEIRDRLWTEFGDRYNGDGAAYGPLLKDAYGRKAALDALPR